MTHDCLWFLSTYWTCLYRGLCNMYKKHRITMYQKAVTGHHVLSTYFGALQQVSKPLHAV